VLVLEAIATEAESLGLEVNWQETMLQALSNILDVPPTVTVLEQEVSTVEEFVYLGALIHSSTHSFPDIMRRSAFTHTAMQSLVNQLWWSRIALSTKLRLYNICIVYITYNICIYYICCNIYMCVYCRYFPVRVKSAGRLPRKMHTGSMPSINGVCMLLGIKWYHFISNDEVWRQTNQPLLTEIIQAQCLTLFGYIPRMDDKQILTSSPSVYWQRPPGRPQMTWMKTVQNDLDSHGLSWTEAVDLAQNRPLWRLLATSGVTHS